MTLAPRRITARDNPLLARLRKLAGDPGGYRKAGELWIEGEHLCEAFVAKGGTARQAVVASPAGSARQCVRWPARPRRWRWFRMR
jgi:TrmH family RNA methyltransferase